MLGQAGTAALLLAHDARRSAPVTRLASDLDDMLAGMPVASGDLVLVGADNDVTAADLGLRCRGRGHEVGYLAARSRQDRALSALVSLRVAYLAVLRVFGWLAFVARSD